MQLYILVVVKNNQQCRMEGGEQNREEGEMAHKKLGGGKNRGKK